MSPSHASPRKQQFDMVVDDPQLGKPATDSLIGGIHFVIGGVPVPMQNWRDNIPGVVEMWVEVLDPLFKGQSSSAELWFMHGPYALAVERTGRGSLRLALLDDHEPPAERFVTVVDESVVRERLHHRLRALVKSHASLLTEAQKEKIIRFVADV